MKYTIISVVVAFLLCWFVADATSPPHCFFEPTSHIFFPGQTYIHYKPNGWCYRRAICKRDYSISVQECADVPCAADKLYIKEEFPDCCCGESM